jgi:hypothetical protein
MAAIYAAPERNDPDTLREPLLEGLAFLRQGKVTPDVSPRSTLNWSNYITSLTTKGPDAARPALKTGSGRCHASILFVLLNAPPQTK